MKILGHLIEGTLEQDPLTDEFSIRTLDSDGNPISVSLKELLSQYAGQDIRFTLNSFENLQKLADLVGASEGLVQGVMPEDIPVAFQVHRKQ